MRANRLNQYLTHTTIIARPQDQAPAPYLTRHLSGADAWLLGAVEAYLRGERPYQQYEAALICVRQEHDAAMGRLDVAS